MIFGAFIPQGWKLELAGLGGPEQQWARAVEIAQLAEAHGYDSLWVYDHVHNVPVPSNESMFECWTTMAAISQVTDRIRLGQMVGCASYRNPALLAKITASIDVMSGGRLDWGIGAGWYDQEYRAYGYDFPSAADRIRGMRETVEIVKALWSEPEATYEGRIYSVAGFPRAGRRVGGRAVRLDERAPWRCRQRRIRPDLALQATIGPAGSAPPRSAAYGESCAKGGARRALRVILLANQQTAVQES
jgi:alkanesulfonate monooxygenase SsuD/methylene tetrahydromethanopterin reductase-like flavin-dependent oxidoreductase (luciferase family)